MKNLLGLAAVAALCFAGCKKKSETSPAPAAGSGTVAKATEATPAATPPAAATAKSCEDLGGTKSGDICTMKTPAPFEVTFTGKFDTDMYHQEPGAVFKVTNKSDRPLSINNAQLYAYDKTGKQLEIEAGGSRVKYAQDSKGGMLELEPGQSKDLIHSIGKKNLPADMDTVQVEITSWSSMDGKDRFERNVDNVDTRPKDGWK